MNLPAGSPLVADQSSLQSAGGQAPPDVRFPPGLFVLFFTEMWERFSYYGMRALLVLYMVAAVSRGGMELDDRTATAIYGIYTAVVYLVALPGGWMADRLLGARRAVWYGGWLIAAGHFTLAWPDRWTFFSGLLLIVLGTGLLKPNISVLVGHLYPQGGPERDSGFTVFYMGINLGAALGPLVCSYLGEKVNWHAGFAAAGVGMLLALATYWLLGHRLGAAGLQPASRPAEYATRRDPAWWWVVGGAAAACLAVALIWGAQRIWSFGLVEIADASSLVIAVVGGAALAAVWFFGRLDAAENRRMVLLALLLLAAALFWSGFEQAGSSFNLFAERFTQRQVPGFEKEIPAGWFQSVNPVLIIVLSPLMAAAWVGLASRGLNLSIPFKFGLGLLLLGLGFLVIQAGAQLVAEGQRVTPVWLLGTYLIHTVGELCLSPVGLSAVTKLAPRRFVGQMMGMWFLSTSLGNLLAAQFAGETTTGPQQMVATYGRIALMGVLSGLAMLLISPWLSRWALRNAADPAVQQPRDTAG